MPRVRTPPCGFGISPLRTACAMYSLAHSARLTFVPGALSHGFNSATVSPSTPGAPSLLTTRSYALCMLLRSTTASINRGASGFVCSAAADRASAPTPDPGKFRLPSPSWAVLTYASALSPRIEVCCPTPVFHVQPFALRLLWPRLTSGSPSQHLSMSVALKQTARSPRVLRTHLPAYACRIYAPAFRARTGLCIYMPAHPTVPPLSASCSSGQRFAYSFLPIPPRDGHRCRSANTSPCRACRGLSPPSECALPGAHKERLSTCRVESRQARTEEPEPSTKRRAPKAESAGPSSHLLCTKIQRPRNLRQLHNNGPLARRSCLTRELAIGR